MHLPDSHIFYSAIPDVMEIVKPLNKLGITAFSFSRKYHDGSRIYLDDRYHSLDIYLKQKYYLCSNTEYKPDMYKDQVLLWSTTPNQKILDDCDRAFGIDHGIWLFESNENYCETFTFATNSRNDRIINVYLSKMDLLKSFKEFFREKASSIIKQAEKQKIILPFNELVGIKRVLQNIEDPILRNTKSSNDYSLTLRQFECCVLLLKGKTAKEIGVSLKLSARTVEYYLDIIKTKLNCKKKSELIIKLSKLIK